MPCQPERSRPLKSAVKPGGGSTGGVAAEGDVRARQARAAEKKKPFDGVTSELLAREMVAETRRGRRT
jgi:hypothetical protein